MTVNLLVGNEGYLKDEVSLVGRHVRSQEIDYPRRCIGYQEMKQYVDQPQAAMTAASLLQLAHVAAWYWFGIR